MDLTEQLTRVEERFEELDRLMADPGVLSDYARVSELAQERSKLEELVGAWRRYQDLQEQLNDNRDLLAENDDPELAELAELEIAEIEPQVAGLEDELRRMLLPKDPNDDKNVIVEIRAGAGGDEAGLFAADLLRMYSRWADDHKFKTEIMSSSETGVGGIKEAILEVRVAEPTAASNMNRVSIAFSASPQPRARAASTPALPRWPFCRRPRT